MQTQEITMEVAKELIKNKSIALGFDTDVANKIADNWFNLNYHYSFSDDIEDLQQHSNKRYFLLEVFIWFNSPEGHNYWSDLSRS